MINWLVNQSVVLSLLIALLILASSLANKTLGATNTYLCWLVVPLSVVMGGVAHLTQPQLSVEVYEVVQRIPLISSSTESPAFINNVNALVYVWVLGIFLLLAALVVNHRHFMQTITKQDNPYHGELSYALTHRGKTPFVVGLVHPTLVIPRQFEKLYSSAQQKLLIQHEHTHIKHGDLWWNFLAIIVCVVFWFNPLMWLAYRYFRQQQELACDQSVLKAHSLATRKLYADAMITAATSCRRGLFSPLHYSEVNTMKARIHALKSHKKNKLLPVALVMTLSTTSLVLAHTAIAGQKAGFSPNIVERVAPVYPIDAAKNSIEGYVTVSFDVSQEGTVSDVRVVESQPEGVFNSSAVYAVKQWRYAPSEHIIEGALVQLDYKLSPDSAVVTPGYEGTEIVSVDSEK